MNKTLYADFNEYEKNVNKDIGQWGPYQDWQITKTYINNNTGKKGYWIKPNKQAVGFVVDHDTIFRSDFDPYKQYDGSGYIAVTYSKKPDPYIYENKTGYELKIGDIVGISVGDEDSYTCTAGTVVDVFYDLKDASKYKTYTESYNVGAVKYIMGTPEVANNKQLIVNNISITLSDFKQYIESSDNLKSWTYAQTTIDDTIYTLCCNGLGWFTDEMWDCFCDPVTDSSIQAQVIADRIFEKYDILIDGYAIARHLKDVCSRKVDYKVRSVPISAVYAKSQLNLKSSRITVAFNILKFVDQKYKGGFDTLNFNRKEITNKITLDMIKPLTGIHKLDIYHNGRLQSSTDHPELIPEISSESNNIKDTSLYYVDTEHKISESAAPYLDTVIEFIKNKDEYISQLSQIILDYKNYTLEQRQEIFDKYNLITSFVVK